MGAIVEHLFLRNKLCSAEHTRIALVVPIQGKYEEAELLYKRSLAIHERVYGPDHPEVVTTLSNWAGLLKIQVRTEGCFWTSCRLSALSTCF